MRSGLDGDRTVSTEKHLTVSALIEQARQAQQSIENYSQRHIDRLVDAVAWAIIHPENNRALGIQA